MPRERDGQNLHGKDHSLQPGEQTGSPEGVRDPEVPPQREGHGSARGLRHAAIPGAGGRVLHRQRAAVQPHRQVGGRMCQLTPGWTKSGRRTQRGGGQREDLFIL